MSDKVEVKVTSNTVDWYNNLGYNIPVREVQLYCINNKGNRIKNGVVRRFEKGTTILVDIDHLPPNSNKKIEYECEDCSSIFSLRYDVYLKKKRPNICDPCSKKKVKTTGSHSYWVSRLIKDNPEARCDISGETDKRFLVLHHLNSRSNGGKNEEENYVILSANYHLAFHVWNGGTNKPCTKEQYYEFKKQELQ